MLERIDMTKTEKTKDPDIQMLRECLDAILDQLLDGANLNPVIRIMGALTRIEESYVRNQNDRHQMRRLLLNQSLLMQYLAGECYLKKEKNWGKVFKDAVAKTEEVLLCPTKQ